MPTPKHRPRAVAGIEPRLVAELRSAMVESGATSYALAKASGLDEATVRKFVSRERSLKVESAGKLAEALGLRLVRPSRPRKFPGHARPAAVITPEDQVRIAEVARSVERLGHAGDEAPEENGHPMSPAGGPDHD